MRVCGIVRCGRRPLLIRLCSFLSFLFLAVCLLSSVYAAPVRTGDTGIDLQFAGVDAAVGPAPAYREGARVSDGDGVGDHLVRPEAVPVGEVASAASPSPADARAGGEGVGGGAGAEHARYQRLLDEVLREVEGARDDSDQRVCVGESGLGESSSSSAESARVRAPSGGDSNPDPDTPPFGALRLQSVVASGCRLSFATCNARNLCSASDAGKVHDLAALLGLRAPLRVGAQLNRPDVFLVTETMGVAGFDMRGMLEDAGIMAVYDAVWSQRSTSLGGRAACAAKIVGGGLLLLVRRDLQAVLTKIKLECPDEDRPLLDGHLMAFRLDPPAESEGAQRGTHCLRSSVAITCCYLSPGGGQWGNKVNEAVLDALEQSEQSLLDLRRTSKSGVAHLVMGHFNAQFATRRVELRLNSGQSRFEEIEAAAQSDTRRGTLEVDGSTLWLQPRVAVSTDTVDNQYAAAIGARLLSIMSESGMCSAAGVLDAPTPTSWTLCKRCKPRKGRCACEHSKMRRLYDMCFVEADVVVDALVTQCARSALHLTYMTRRIDWSAMRSIDHAVTYGSVLLPPLAAHVGSVVQMHEGGSRVAQSGRRQRRPRMKMPQERERRDEVQAKVSSRLECDGVLLREMRAAATVARKDELLVNACLAAGTEALQSLPVSEWDARAESVEREVRTLRQQVRAVANRRAALVRVRDAGGDVASEISAANRELGALRRQRERRRHMSRAQILRASSMACKKRHWTILKKMAEEPGMPPRPQCNLLARLNDERGRLVSLDPNVIRARILQYREKVFSLRSDMADETLGGVLSDALALAAVNREAAADRALSHESAAARSAREPLSVWHGKQVQPLPASSDEVRASAAEVLRKGAAVRAGAHGARASQLNADISDDELRDVLVGLEDKGPGLDGVAAESLAGLSEDARLPVLELLNEVWRSGVTPKSWEAVRVVLLYKGHGEDPYSLSSYRGLGIGVLMEKLLALIMLKRLTVFVEESGALHASQGGFRPGRGTAEQNFALSETVRWALAQANTTDPVFLSFIDISRAYDSCIQAKLWARCVEMGVHGRFLAALQAMHAGKKAVLDLGGELLGEQDIECGVLQGNPLSPLLFNIYIDGVLREVDAEVARINSARAGRAGVPLPREHDASAVLASLFYADDGVLMARDQETAQLLLDAVEKALARVGLQLNAKKTKVMIVPTFGTTEEDYKKKKKEVKRTGGFKACGQPVDVVDEFTYLGVRVWWQWTWSRAWQHALNRARVASYLLRQSGWHNQGAALVDQLRLARSLVFTHLDFVAPLAGVEGHSKEIVQCDRVVEKALGTITGVREQSCGAALRADAGMWSYASRTRMLQFRFFVKLSCDASRDSTSYHALCLSRLLSPETAAERERVALSGIVAAPRWSFVKRCLRTAALFTERAMIDGAPCDSLQAASIELRPARALVTVLRQHLDDWRVVTPSTLDLPHQYLRLRSTSAHGAHSIDYATSEVSEYWAMPTAGTGIRAALDVWSHELRLAVFASLRRRANVFRAQHKSELPSLHAKWSQPRSSMRDFLCLQGGSRIGWWWHLPDVVAARRLQKARIGEWGDEYSYRRVDHKATQKTRLLKRIEEPLQRICYLCKSGEPEHMWHLVCECPHGRLAGLRGRVRATLSALVVEAAQVPEGPRDAPKAPDFADDCVFYTIMMGCTAVGKLDHSVSAGVAASLVFPLDGGTMRPACAWLQWLAGLWLSGRDQARSHSLSKAQEALAAIAGHVMHCIAQFSLELHTVRRTLLRADADFADRTLDPASVRPRAKKRQVAAVPSRRIQPPRAAKSAAVASSR